MSKENISKREIYIPWDPIVEAYRLKLLKAGNTPEDIENLFAQRENDMNNKWINYYDFRENFIHIHYNRLS